MNRRRTTPQPLSMWQEIVCGVLFFAMCYVGLVLVLLFG